jgi:hypothetical protein
MAFQKPILHYLQLDAILIVEETIKNKEIYPNKRYPQLKSPRRVVYQTFLLILNDLEKSGKIMFCKKVVSPGFGIRNCKPNLRLHRIDTEPINIKA